MAIGIVLRPLPSPKPHGERGQGGTIAYGFLKCYDAVNTIGAEDAELAFVITAEVDEAATTLTSAG